MDEAGCNAMQHVRHDQEIRTVQMIMQTYIYEKALSMDITRRLGNQLVDSGLLDPNKWDSWRETEYKKNSKYPTKKETLQYFKKWIQKDFRARDILITWLGNFNEKARKTAFEDERQFSIREIYKRHDYPFAVQRREFEKFGFKVGSEDGPNCVFQALSNITSPGKENQKKVRESIVSFMLGKRPDKEILDLLRLQITSDIDWQMHCNKFLTNEAADVSVLLAASSRFGANIHIIYRNKPRRDLFVEYIIYASPVVSDTNFYLGGLGRGTYVSLKSATGTDQDDDTEHDIVQSLKKVIEEQEIEIQTLESAMKEYESEIAELKTKKRSSEIITESKTRGKIQHLEDTIVKLKERIKTLVREKEKKEIERQKLIKELKAEKERQEKSKLEHGKKVKKLEQKFVEVVDNLKKEFTKALHEALSIGPNDEEGNECISQNEDSVEEEEEEEDEEDATKDRSAQAPSDRQGNVMK